MSSIIRQRACYWARGFSSSSPSFRVLKNHQKQDTKKSQLYSRVMNDIITAARRGGSPNPANNIALSIALRKAKMADVPKDKIEVALTRAASTSSEDALQASVFEAIGPGSTPMIIECLSNSTNRTSKVIKEILSNKGGRLAPVAYLFERKGSIVLKPRDGSTFEQVWESAVDAGAESVEEATDGNEGEIEIITEPSQLSAIATTLTSGTNSHTIESMELVYIPTEAANESSALAEGSDDHTKASALIQHLKDESDCINVWTVASL